MHLALLTAFNYPDGGPAAARHMALAAGLAANGHRTTFTLTRQVELPLSSEPLVRWTSVASQVDSRLGWRVAAGRRFGAALDAVAAAHPLDAVMLIGRDPLLVEAGIRAARRRGLPCVYELTEYPDVIRRPGALDWISEKVFVHRHLRRFDGLMVISSALRRFAQEHSSKPILVTGPMLDLAKHPALPALPLSGTLTVGYAGSLREQKDGVLTLIKAAAHASTLLSPRVSVELEILGGDLKAPDGQAAASQATAVGMSERVNFHGTVPHAEVRDLLSRCHVLALPRPASRQATGGFPTKLGEYLATGRPVVVTPVGDIPSYLVDRESCFMSAPGDERALAQRLVWIAENYALARTVGQNGRKLAENRFAAARQSVKVADFLERLPEFQAQQRSGPSKPTNEPRAGA